MKICDGKAEAGAVLSMETSLDLWSSRLLPNFSPNRLPSTRQLLHGAPGPGDVKVFLTQNSGARSVPLPLRPLLMVL